MLTQQKFPYIDFETENYLHRHENNDNKTRQLRIMAQLEELYSPFEGLSGNQCAQTLDQSYYDMLHIDELKERDKDQVVYKWFLENIKRERMEGDRYRHVKEDKNHQQNSSDAETADTGKLGMYH
jgi:hypothetical protein